MCYLFVGKSLYIQRLYEKLEGTVTMGTTFRKCIRLIEPKVDEHIILQSMFETPESKEHKVFHFDVTSSVRILGIVKILKMFIFFCFMCFICLLFMLFRYRKDCMNFCSNCSSCVTWPIRMG